MQRLKQLLNPTLAKIRQSIFNAQTDDVVINLRCIQWAKLVWHNQYGNERPTKPKVETYRGSLLSTIEYVLPTKGMPRETEWERAERMGLKDEWLPVLYLQLTANHRLKFTGQKALSLWEAYKAKQFSGNNKQKKDK